MPKNVVSKELAAAEGEAVGGPADRVVEEEVGVPGPGTGCSR